MLSTVRLHNHPTVHRTHTWAGNVLLATHTPLDPLGEGARADCSDDQFDQHLEEASTVADRIVDSLSKS